MLFYHIKNNNIMLSDNIKPQYTNDKRKSNKFFFGKEISKILQIFKIKNNNLHK